MPAFKESSRDGRKGAGYIVFSEFINKPEYENGNLVDQIGRKVYPAPWFVRTFLPFPTDAVSEPIESEIGESIVYPQGPKKYLLGWKWSIIDWFAGLTVLVWDTLDTDYGDRRVNEKGCFGHTIPHHL